MQGHYSKDRQVNDTVKAVIRAGWQFTRTRKHGRVITPEGKKITVPNSPSDFRACMNFKAQLRREGAQLN